MSNYLNITLQQRIDAAAINAGNVQLIVVNAYAPELESTLQLDTADMSPDTLEAFRTVTDFLTYAFEATCPVIKVAFDVDGYLFDFSESYMRNAQNTLFDTPIENGLLLGVRFEFPGFNLNPFLGVVYEWGKGFTPEDKTALLENITTRSWHNYTWRYRYHSRYNGVHCQQRNPR